MTNNNLKFTPDIVKPASIDQLKLNLIIEKTEAIHTNLLALSRHLTGVVAEIHNNLSVVASTLRYLKRNEL